MPSTTANATPESRPNAGRGAWRAATVLLSLGTAWNVAAQTAPELQLLTSHFPPYTMASGADAPGPLVKLSQAVVARAGLSAQLEFMPWPRVQVIAQREDRQLVIPLVRSAERELKYQWIGRLYCRRMVLISLRSHMPRLSDEALESARIAVLRAAPHKATLKVKEITEAISFEDMAKMLSMGMVDALYGNQEASLAALRERGVEPNALVVSSPQELDAMWLAASPGMPATQIERLRQAFQAVQANGSMERLLTEGGLAKSSCSSL